jgi:hypothetical protein
MAGKPTDRTAAGCLALFALPFAAVGVVALYLTLDNLWSWARMSRWDAVPAQLESLDLATHNGDKSTTYEVRATYRYSFSGREYTGDRVAINRMADNIGSFQRDLYSKLEAARQRGGRVEAYVDPSNPASATLNRDLRGLLVAFESLFALVFGGVGFGLIFGVRVGFRRLAATRALQARHPDEPWRWRADWAEGKIRSSARTSAYGAAGFAALWNAVAIPTGIIVWPEIEKGNYVALVGLLFPIAGVGLAVWAIRAWRRAALIKSATLELQHTPVALGGRIRGAIRIDGPTPDASEFKIEVSCVERRRAGGQRSDQSERILWQGEWTVPRGRCEVTDTYASIPLDLSIPGDQPAATGVDDTDTVLWQLDASAGSTGRDFWLRFELPVFAVADASPDAAAEIEADAAATGPDAHVLESLGIAYERLPQGGESWTFRRAQHKSTAAAVTAFAMVFGAAALGLWFAKAPAFFALAFACFDALLLWFASDLWFTEYRVTLDRGLLTVAKRGIAGARTPVQIPQAWIRAIRAQRGMQSGHKLYYDLRVETAEDSLTAARSIEDYSVAVWLAKHWQGPAPALSGERA